MALTHDVDFRPNASSHRLRPKSKVVERPKIQPRAQYREILMIKSRDIWKNWSFQFEFGATDGPIRSRRREKAAVLTVCASQITNWTTWSQSVAKLECSRAESAHWSNGRRPIWKLFSCFRVAAICIFRAVELSARQWQCYALKPSISEVNEAPSDQASWLARLLFQLSLFFVIRFDSNEKLKLNDSEIREKFVSVFFCFFFFHRIRSVAGAASEADGGRSRWLGSVARRWLVRDGHVMKFIFLGNLIWFFFCVWN